jgi:hypothetical protein
MGARATFQGLVVMITPQALLEHVKAKPFQPLRMHMASGRTFDIRHPEMIKVLKSCALVFGTSEDGQEIPDDWETVSLTLIEFVSGLEPQVR